MLIRVRKCRSVNRKYVNYKYNAGGSDLNHEEMREYSSFKFLYAKSMEPEDIVKVKEKWKHKLGETDEK